VEQSRSREANRSSASQEIPAFYGTRKFITAFTNTRHLSPYRARPIHSVLSSHVLKIHFNIIIPSMRSSFKWSVSLRFPHQNPLCTSPVSHMCHVHRSSYFACNLTSFYKAIQCSGIRTSCRLARLILGLAGSTTEQP
jgi:hypothetical protein